MRQILFLLLICSCAMTYGQCTVTLCQLCGNKDITVFYKDGSEGAKGVRLNDSCVSYSIPVTEPFQLAFLVGEDNVHLKRLWVDPRFGKTRTVTLDNCTGNFIRHDTISLDIDDAPDQKITEDYISGKISMQDSLFLYQEIYEEQYIQRHPDSFLAVHYLKGLINHLDFNTAVKYRDLVKKNNSQYSAMKSIDSYIENYSFKSVPKIGDPLFEFDAKQIDGKTFDSKSISDKVIVLFFWYSGCGPCHRAMPALNEVYKKYRSQGLDVISFALNSKEEEWKKSSLAYQIPGVNVSDLTGFSGRLFLHYGVSAFPFFVVFDKNKRVSMITFGDDEVPLVESKVRELLGLK